VYIIAQVYTYCQGIIALKIDMENCR